MSKNLIVVPALLKARIESYTRKDGAFVQAHDDKRQAAKPDMGAVMKKHADKVQSKATEWDHKGYAGQTVPHADVAHLPEFSHKEVYGHDGKTSPAASDFHRDFAGKAPQHFLLKHPNGKRSLVNTEGYGYARETAPVGDAESAADPRAAYAEKRKLAGEHGQAALDAAEKARNSSDPTHAADAISAVEKGWNAHKEAGKAARAVPYPGSSSPWEHHDERAGALSKMSEEMHQLHQKLSGKPATKPTKRAAPKKESAPTTKSGNEDYGFHGEAVNEHLRSKHGADDYYSKSTEKDHIEAKAAAEKKFSASAHQLVQAGHFDKHEHARDYLDSTSGRHLHDAAPDGDVSKVGWLAKDVKNFKSKNAGMQKSMLLVHPDLLKAHVSAFTRKDGVFVAEHDDKRQEAAPKPDKMMLVAAGNHDEGEGFKFHGGDVVHHDRVGPGKQHGVATSKNADGSHSHYFTGNGGSTWSPMGTTEAGGDAKSAHDKVVDTLKQMHAGS